ncbi:MAG TPA: chromosome segregation protein SMC [Gemmatimonadota bacterium]|nr:chromosome segregation protein SMC [Gemmatimonadota bacterium]
MKLQRLELFGFKSFADRVVIEFNAGLTAIVGPNGCGKSNISDAIRWVLGEQRPTLVRGARMDDVIFGGSRERKPINLAEVTLRFTNDDGQLPVDYTDVAIARRVFRDAESEYLLNRNVCRLKDIQDLLFGTGVGAHSYSLIQQGMVDSILSDRTEERRTIFEEAAGVTRYKSRRRATERKLEAATHDLRRVEDIVAEVERTVGALKRQVGKARRFQEYRSDERRLDIHVTGRDLAAIDDRRAPLVEELRGLEEVEAAQAARLTEREAAVEALELVLIEAREAEGGIRAEADGLRRQIGRREESLLVIGETLKHHARRFDSLAAESERARIRSDDLAERRANLEVDHRVAGDRLAGVAARIDGGGGAGGEEDRHAELEAERARLTSEVESHRDRLEQVRQAAARQSTTEEGAAERAEALAAELAACGAEAEAARHAAASARAELDAWESQWAAAQDEVGRGRQAEREASLRTQQAMDRLAAERADEHAAAGRAEALAALEARLEGYTGGAQALLGASAPIAGLLGSLPQAIEPRETRYEAAIERYVEILGNGLLLADREAAERVAARLADSDGGRADFLVPEFLATGPEPEIPDPAAAVVLARGEDVIRWKASPEVAERFAPLFSRLLLVSDRPAAFRCRAALAESPAAARHYVIAGLDGTLLDGGGRWRTGRAPGDEGLLARRRRLAEAEAERAVRRKAAEALQAEAAAAKRVLQEAQRSLEGASARAEATDREQRAARERRVLAEAAENQATGRVTELEARIAGAISTRDRARDAAQTIHETEIELAADLQRAMDRLASVRSALERLDGVRAERLSARHATELERMEAEADLRAAARELEHLAAAEEALAAARAERAAERARLEEDGTRLESERVAAAAEIEALHGALDAAERRLRESSEALREIEERRTEHEAEIRALRRRHEETVERRHECALARQDLDYRRGTLLAHVTETYAAEMESLLADHPLEEAEAGLPLEDLRARLEEVRRKRDNLGPVNLLALEEYEAEAARFDFLSRQRDDLIQAKRQLEEAIRKINATARVLFLETFERVRENFDATFQTLFEGGHAEIALSDPDDPLESPIEIVASPRGKRVQSINLLSGGERALTALSLLFAIYRVKPSPFCILDEVDAPLDDANVSRFLAMIRHFSAETQFIIITHNRRTMEAADYLYGVTMEEPGVSTLVSVSLDEEGADADRRVEFEAQDEELSEGVPNGARAVGVAKRVAALVG